MKMFVHIPRTGGTSLRYVFREWYGDKLLTAYDNNKVYDTTGCDLAYGHYYIDDCEYMLFLREPYLQQLSYYNYTVKYTDMPSVDDFFTHEVSSMVKFLPPMDKVVFVGIYERYLDDINRLSDFLGMDKVEPIKTNTSTYKHIPSEEAIDTFKKNNEYIYELYNKFL